MDDFGTAVENAKDLLDAAAAGARDISDVAVRNTIENVILAVRELEAAITNSDPG
jgi:hypothetical protein